MRKLIIPIIMALTILLSGCVESPELTDEDHISELIRYSNLSKVTNLDGTGDPGEDGKGTEEVSRPEFWYRQLINESSAEIIITGEVSTGICTVSVTRKISAELIIDTVWDGEFIPGSKPINVTRYTKFIVEKHENESSHGGWRIISATASEHMLTSDEQEVFITSMRLYKDDELIWECTDPTAFYNVESELPVLLEGDFIRMEATVDHLNPVYDPEFFVIAHGPLSGHSRHIMYDNGLYGDETAEDGVFTYEWYVEYTGFHQRIAVDAIDTDTFEDQTEEDYDSSAWGIHFLKY